MSMRVLEKQFSSNKFLLPMRRLLRFVSLRSQRHLLIFSCKVLTVQFVVEYKGSSSGCPPHSDGEHFLSRSTARPDFYWCCIDCAKHCAIPCGVTELIWGNLLDFQYRLAHPKSFPTELFQILHQTSI